MYLFTNVQNDSNFPYYSNYSRYLACILTRIQEIQAKSTRETIYFEYESVIVHEDTKLFTWRYKIIVKRRSFIYI